MGPGARVGVSAIWRNCSVLIVRKRIVLGALYVLLTLVVLDGALWFFYNRVRGHFDEELGRRLARFREDHPA